MGYMTNFLVYVFAMVGVILLALLVFKHATGYKSRISDCKSLKIVDALTLTPRKTLYVISTGNEKFLIAGDSERTTLISKLDSQAVQNESYRFAEEKRIKTTEDVNFRSTLKDLSLKESYTDRKILGINTQKTSPYDSVMKSLAKKIRG